MPDSDANASLRERIRVVSLVQAETVTGPMKPLLMFTRNIQVPEIGRSGILQTAVTTVRAHGQGLPHPNGFLQAAKDAGLAVDVIPERFPFDPAILPKLARHLAGRAPHIVETHDFKSHFLVWLLKKTHGLPAGRWVAFHHGYTRMSPRVRVYQQLDRLSLREADQVITVCAPFVQQLAKRGVEPRRMRILANAIESRDRASASEILRLKEQMGLRPADRTIVSVGRLSVEKGHTTLISAFRQLQRDPGSQDLRLVLVGDGGEMDNLRTIATDLRDRVIFTGHVGDPWPYYCMADAFALPSYSEGSPLALFEAMSAALPIVASSVGGIPETLSDGASALLVRAGIANDLAFALDRVLRETSLADSLGRNAKAIAAQFTPELYTKRRISFYESLLNKAPNHIH